jgi:hypothetical protein
LGCAGFCLKSNGWIKDYYTPLYHASQESTNKSDDILPNFSEKCIGQQDVAVEKPQNQCHRACFTLEIAPQLPCRELGGCTMLLTITQFL